MVHVSMCVCVGKEREEKVHVCVLVQESTAETKPKADWHACSMSSKLSRVTETPSWSPQSGVTLMLLC